MLGDGSGRVNVMLILQTGLVTSRWDKGNALVEEGHGRDQRLDPVLKKARFPQEASML